MKLLVCFKIVRDFDSVMAKDWEKAGTAAFDLSYAMKQISCYDEAALETALRIKDADQETVVEAITIGNEDYDFFYRNLFAVGIDRIIQLRCEEDLTFRPHKVAERISSYARDYDLILTGTKDSMGENGRVYTCLSSLLSYPCLGSVSSVRKDENGLVVTYHSQGRRKTVLLHDKAVLAIGDSINPYLRMATLREKLKAKNRKAEIFDVNTEGEDDYVIETLYQERKDRHCRFIEGKDTETKMKELFAYLKKEVER